MTVRDMAGRTGIPSGTLGDYYSGRHLPPISQPDVLAKILKACGVTDAITALQWRQALSRVRHTPGRRPVSAPVPYRGLHIFQPEDADWFFGREGLTAALVGELAGRYRRGGGLLVAIGVSGAGKSSLLRAGLVPALRRGDLGVPGSENWPWLLFTPGEHPLRELARQLAAITHTTQAADEALRSNPRAAADLARRACGASYAGASPDPAADPGHGPRLVMVVDQFEEVFTSCTDETERAAFIAALAAAADESPAVPAGTTAASTSHPAALVVLGLRADFYSHALRRVDLLPALEGRHVVVGPMTEDELRDVIVKPAEKAKIDLEDGLVELLLHDLRPPARTGTSEDMVGHGDHAVPAHEAGALPLLAHALSVTWAHRQRGRMTVAEYEASGGIRGAVAQTADSAYADLAGPEQEETARQLFLRLVHVAGDTADTRRRVSRTELLDSYGQTQAEELAAVLYQFVDRRLITLDRDQVEIAHDSLLSAWPRLREWIDADRAGLATHRQLADAARNWLDSGREPDLLHRGGRLAAVRDWATAPAHQAELNQLEREFLAASVERHDAEQRATRRRTRRLRQLLALMVVLALLATTGAGYALVQRRAALDQRDVAISRQVAGDANRLRGSDPALAAQLSLVAYRLAPTVAARSSLLDSYAAPNATRVLSPVPQATAFTSDGRIMATGGSDPTNTAVQLWSLADPRKPAALSESAAGHTDQVNAMAFSPDGRTLASGGADKTVRLWDVSNPAAPRTLGTPLTGPTDAVLSLAYSPDGRVLAVGGTDTTVRLWDVVDPRRPVPLPPALTGPTDAVRSVAFSPTAPVLAVGSVDHSVRLWDVTDPTHPVSLGEPLTGPRSVQYVAFSPDGRTLAAGGGDKAVRLWDVTAPAAPVPLGEPLTGPAGVVNALAFSSGGTHLAAASSDNKVWVWELATRRATTTLPHPAPATMVRFLHGDRILLTTAYDGATRLWDLPGPVIADPTDTVFTAVVGSDGHTLLAAADGSDRTARLWDLADPRRPAPLGPPVSAPTGPGLSGAAGLSPDQQTVAAGTLDGPLLRWDVTDPEHPVQLETLTGAEDIIESVAFSPDGRMLAVGSDDHTVRLWDVTDPDRPAALTTLDQPGRQVYATTFSRDGLVLAAASGDKKVWLWDLHDRQHPQLAASLPGATKEVYSVAISPDSHILAAGSADKTVRLWDITDPHRPIPLGDPLTGPNNSIYWLTFNPDGHTLAAAGGDGTVWLWDLTDPRHARTHATLTGLSNAIWMVSFSPDGHTLAAGGADTTVRLWETDPDRVSAHICAVAGDPITPVEWNQYLPDTPYNPPCPRTR